MLYSVTLKYILSTLWAQMVASSFGLEAKLYYAKMYKHLFSLKYY